MKPIKIFPIEREPESDDGPTLLCPSCFAEIRPAGTPVLLAGPSITYPHACHCGQWDHTTGGHYDYWTYTGAGWGLTPNKETDQ